MRTLLAFVLGGIIGFAAHWYINERKPASLPVRATERTVESGEVRKNTFDSATIKDELARSGQVIREKARQAGNAISDAASNTRISATIKGKLLKESNLSALAIDVDTNDGVVTLSGNVSSHDQIARAMQLALDTDGVHKVVSTLQVKEIK